MFLFALFAVLCFNVLDIAFPKLLQLLIDAVGGKPLRFLGISLDGIMEIHNGIFFIPVAIIVFALLHWGFSYCRLVLQTKLGQNALYDIRNRIYNTIQSLSFTFHDRIHSGTLISNVVEDVSHLSRFLEFGMFPLIESPIYIVTALSVLYHTCWPAAVASTMLLILSVIITFLYFKYGKKYFARTKRIYAENVQMFTENVDGHLVVRAYGKALQQKKEYDKKSEELHNAIFTETIITSIMSQSYIFATIFGVFVTMGISLTMMRNYGWEFSPGELFLIFFLQSSLTPRARMLTRGIDLLMRIQITADRLVPLFGSKEYLKDSGTQELIKTGPGILSVRNVNFLYDNRCHALKDVSLDIKAGQTVGFVGSTGAGKSTLSLLLSRFYDPNTGSILLDGNDIRQFPVDEIRKQFSLVFQETFLFSASVSQNIAYGSPGATMKEIENAAKVAQIHDFIQSIPEGYDTQIGEKGVTLSGGQRQRLSIARAVLQKPRFLILDDCTSALDTETEKAIVNSMNELDKRTTKIIIAHRFSSIAEADIVYVLVQGRIVEQGKPEHLNRPGTTFSRILQTQRTEGNGNEYNS